ncbi:hypothetical protein CMI40_02780 [Candidatus Pacearchaeota archaeon]|jgi:hypothetical protein|nr:hypothetical protein [Candidatus Pacearchaeota archaeon]|tara:strand:- start:1401 stop:1715 length:315 start_codon:yes stop_codon:yes gene_type:complete
MSLGLEQYTELKDMEEKIRRKIGPNKLWALQNYSFEAAIYTTKEVLELPLKGKDFMKLAKIWREGIIKGFYKSINHYDKPDDFSGKAKIHFLNKGEIKDWIMNV